MKTMYVRELREKETVGDGGADAGEDEKESGDEFREIGFKRGRTEWIGGGAHGQLHHFGWRKIEDGLKREREREKKKLKDCVAKLRDGLRAA